MVVSRGKIIADGMLRAGTPIIYYKDFDLYVKREDLSCPKPGPPFSKTRGVYARVKSRRENLIGVLDTYHSQAGHAVARACSILGKRCLNFYPKYKADKEGDEGLRPPQLYSRELGAELEPLQAGRSCILFHQAKKLTESAGGYMMPNALKLFESVEETAKEVPNEYFDQVLIPASSGTIAAGVVKGFVDRGIQTEFIIHLGYSRSVDQVYKYIQEQSGYRDLKIRVVDENYGYKDKSLPLPDYLEPSWPSNPYYDLKAFRWYLNNRSQFYGKTLFWNIG